MKKPSTAAGYDTGLALEAKRMCLHIATILGDVMDDIVVVGGLVPYLIIDQQGIDEPHVGTRDLDLGLSLALLDDTRYREISARLRDRGFAPGRKAEGQITRQTWVLPSERVTIDFLIPRAPHGPPPGRLQDLERDFAAIVTPALPVAFLDSVAVTLDDLTLRGERACRTVRVCGPAAFVVMKAHAFRGRGDNKDAYDLVYVLKHFGHHALDDVIERFAALAADTEARDALTILHKDFASADHLGPRRAAEFRYGRADPIIQADAFGYVQAFLAGVRPS